MQEIWKYVVTEPAKDINSIYSSYNLAQHQYVETTENESYHKVKSKWLIFQSQCTGETKMGSRKNQAGLKTEAI
ncbi:hypothetical protein VroAM7_07870 [Vibrio rotiferianus]|uniref:Uncharacterized protein n=1 Tax=Vibrio rotiferianus TaxID=190895 RepID=A0A510I392_9VIBR|nr:hypothetical protein VroAM7_07870 [Vibrio rotiferianus]